jgi:hypothetical protein
LDITDERLVGKFVAAPQLSLLLSRCRVGIPPPRPVCLTVSPQTPEGCSWLSLPARYPSQGRPVIVHRRQPRRR